MNLWFRFFWLLLSSLWRPKLNAPEDVSRLRLRVWPSDLDTNLHMTNSRYWSVFDLGRTDLIARTQLGKAVLKHKWAPILGTGTVRFFRELRPFARYTLETRLAYWQGSRIVIEQRVRSDDGNIAAIGLLSTGLYDRKQRQFVDAQTVLRSAGAQHVDSPAPSPAIEALLQADAALKQLAVEH